MSTPLWAPWRMKYILGEGRAEGCFFCAHPKDAAALRENLALVAHPHACGCLSRCPFTTSHLLVAPRRHVADPTELSEEEYDALRRLVRLSVARLRQAVSWEAMNV